ncbi:hypothetical protein PR202_ga04629 [Eleusine coracana subsp. coracana]|uniref:Uncharacterized protein n=1 Tax=Eleusine coracana subsp. coracana TaxID=191504 RepID=A0AAV5BTF9_ELECO|nr:hypothetical protein PR202_ga04629 [Eleusine coracana subsp. coracana]
MTFRSGVYQVPPIMRPRMSRAAIRLSEATSRSHNGGPEKERRPDLHTALRFASGPRPCRAIPASTQDADTNPRNPHCTESDEDARLQSHLKS